MKKPEVWMISISDNPISQHYKNICVPSWQKFGYSVNHFEAITPRSLKNSNNLKFYKKIRKDGKTTVDFTETEKSVWYSHYYLWEMCVNLNEPIIVVEHDAFCLSATDQLHDTEFTFMCNNGKRTKNGNLRLLPCGAYYLTPKAAKVLITKTKDKFLYKDHGEFCIFQNVDGFIVYYLVLYPDEMGVKLKVSYILECSTQIIDNDIGTTIEHNK
jgi:GR25 family glycosyltransferase involved in LPS biosynthesis